MSQKANPTTIGLFIVVGVALGVIGLITFSSGKLFGKQHRYILYFDASLKGLNPGAPVKLRGVTIGSVAEVLISHNQANGDFSMPVIIDIDEELLRARTDRQLDLGRRASFDRIVQRGLRGKLDAESLVTGVLYVELEFDPNAPPAKFHQLVPEYSEIPTMPTMIQELLSNLANFDIEGISDKLSSLLSKLEAAVDELDVAKLNRGLNDLVFAMNNVVGSPDLTNSLAQLRMALEDARALVKKLDGHIDPLAASLTNTLATAQQTLINVRRGVEQISGLAAPDSQLQNSLAVALEELGSAARAVEDLAEFLKRHPNSLISGKKTIQSGP